MAAISMYNASMPALVRMMKNLLAIIAKAEAMPDAPKLLEARLAPDMHPLMRQFQSVSDTAKFGAARLAGQTAPAFPDTETTFAEIKDRLQKTIDYVESVDPSAIDGSEEREVVLKFPNGQMNFTGLDYLNTFLLPNFYFHCTTAYAILRNNGVGLGKMDFLGRPE
ncbi:MAG TPA: DUF1993 domain-containing protein [Caulobacterales bacterium]|nr:DUF1993 domain-containing protein [Caulobacterales bacterium]